MWKHAMLFRNTLEKIKLSIVIAFQFEELIVITKIPIARREIHYILKWLCVKKVFDKYSINKQSTHVSVSSDGLYVSLMFPPYFRYSQVKCLKYESYAFLLSLHSSNTTDIYKIPFPLVFWASFLPSNDKKDQIHLIVGIL